MGKNTASNKDRAIATRGTKHKVRTEAPCDYLYPPGKKEAQAPFDNEIMTLDKVDPDSNTSKKTLINNMRVWIDQGKVGKPLTTGESASPGNTTHTKSISTDLDYRMEATNTTWSENVFMEGRAVVRTDDRTLQNHENCGGFVDGSEVEITEELTEAYYLRACRIRSLTGETIPDGSETSLVGIKGSSNSAVADGLVAPAKLYKEKPGSKTEDYLEIYNGEEVKLEVVREDATQDPVAVTKSCKLEPDHAHWTTVITNPNPKDGPTGTGDTFKIGKDITDVGLKVETRQARFNLKEGGEFNTGGKGGKTEAFSYAIPAKPEQVAEFYAAQEDPPKITVTAKACAGAQNATIVIKPKGAVKYSVTLENEGTRPGTNKEKLKFSPFGQMIGRVLEVRDIVNRINSVREHVMRQGLTGVGGVSPIFELNFLTSVTLEFACEYQRCSFDRDDFTTAHLRRSWYFMIAGDLLSIKVGIEIVLEQLALTLIGGPVGTAISKALARADLKFAKVEFYFEIKLNMEVGLGIDQHGDFSGEATRIGATVSFTLGVAFTLDLGLVGGTAKLEGTTTGRVWITPTKQKGILAFYNWQVAFESALLLTGRVWRWDVASKKFDGPAFKPDAERRPIRLPS